MNYFSFFSTLYLFLPIIIKEIKLPNEYIGTIGFFYSLGSVLSGLSLSKYIEQSINKNLLINYIIIINIILFFIMIYIKVALVFICCVFLIGYLGSSFVGSNISRSQNKGITIAISSLGFVVGYLLGGILKDFDKMLFIIISLYLISLIISIKVPIFEKEQKLEQEKVDSLIIIKKNWKIYLSLFLRHTGAAGVWIYLSFILINYYDLDLKEIGILHAINIIVQTISNPIIYRFINYQNIIKLISIGYLLSAIYFLLFPISKNFYILSLLQIILGLSFTALYLGNVEYLTKSNKEQITSVTLISSTFSLATSIGSLISAILIKYSYTLLFINGFILSLFSFMIILSQKIKLIIKE